MTPDPLVVRPQTNLEAAARILLERKVTSSSAFELHPTYQSLTWSWPDAPWYIWLSWAGPCQRPKVSSSLLSFGNAYE